MFASVLIFSALFQYQIVFTIAENSTESSNESDRSISASNGKTYFIQLRKTITSDDNEKPSYIQINHYKSSQRFGNTNADYASTQDINEKAFYKKKYHDLFASNVDAPEMIKEAPAEDMQLLMRKRNPNRIDDEWLINLNRTIYDLPNITQEIYEAMLENTKHNAVINASTVKFFFERDTNLSSNIVRFNIESLANISDVIVDAELHVYRLPREDNKTRINSTENVVRLYQMTEQVDEDLEDLTTNSPDSNTTTTTSSSSTKKKQTPDVHKLANVIYISSSYEGWQVFKVRTVVENWRNGDDNLGFLISTVDAHDREDDAVEFAHRDRNGGKYQPTLVVYMDRQVAPNRRPANRRVRKPFKPVRRHELLALNPCRRHVWYVSFHELGWNNFIIAPSGFMAYKCDGSCRSPTASSFTNHGKLLSISEPSGIQGSNSPCCVPNHYKSLLLMFYDKESNIVIKEYEDMIVNSCGCR